LKFSIKVTLAELVDGVDVTNNAFERWSLTVERAFVRAKLAAVEFAQVTPAIAAGLRGQLAELEPAHWPGREPAQSFMVGPFDPGASRAAGRLPVGAGPARRDHREHQSAEVGGGCDLGAV